VPLESVCIGLFLNVWWQRGGGDISPPESWRCPIYHPTEDRRAFRPRHCSKSVQSIR